MSRDSSAEAWLGIYIDLDRLGQFKETRPAQTHVEDRYDPKTGKQLDPVAVCDSDAVEGYRIGDEFCSADPWDDPSLGEALAELAGAPSSRALINCEGQSVGWLVGRELTGVWGTASYGYVTAGTPYCDLDCLGPDLAIWRERLAHALTMTIADELCGIHAVLSVEG